MTTDFDRKLKFTDIASRKWDLLEPSFGISGEDGLAMWIADMDFQVADPIREAAIRAAESGLFTYYSRPAFPTAALARWMKSRHNWNIEESWVKSLFGVIPGLAIAIQEFTKPGDGIIAFTPVYAGILGSIKSNDRRLVEAEMPIRDGRYVMDLEALQENLTGDEKMVVLCSPHNPVGRVWSAEELRDIADFCVRNDMLLISDEVHQDLVFEGSKHIPMAVAAPDIADRLITLTAPSKAFNVAGMTTAFAIIANDDLRERFAARQNTNGSEVNRFGAIVAEAAYTSGGEWLDEVVAYIDQNKKVFRDGINKIPGVNAVDIESTYLVWVDFEGTGMSRREFTDRIQKTAKIAANHGISFGKGGENFLRFNIATRREFVEEAVTRIVAAFDDLQ